eukprot:13179780-Alexandrium_andersonii.AAC.1
MRDSNLMTATEGLFRAIFAELQAQPHLPAILCGDFNADVGAIAPLAQKVEQGEWVDVASLKVYTGHDAGLTT